MSTFTVQWVEGTTCSVLFSDGPDPDTSYSIPDCPVDDQQALIAFISDWWVTYRQQFGMDSSQNIQNWVGRPLAIQPSSQVN